MASAIAALTGHPASREQRRRFSRYLELLVVWNKALDLTALETPEAMVKGLFQDALLFLPLLPSRRPIRVADIGTGAGIPGLPLRIADEEIRLTLVEARRKRVSFLSTVKRELGLTDVEIFHGRAESVLSEHPALAGAFDAVVSRAMAPPAELIGLAAPYLMPGGLLIASGPPPGIQRKALPVGAAAGFREIPYPALGLKRTFLLSVKPG